MQTVLDLNKKLHETQSDLDIVSKEKINKEDQLRDKEKNIHNLKYKINDL